MPTIFDLKVKVYADGADLAGMLEMHRNPLIKGFTTNPTLMRKAGITDYAAFAHDVLGAIQDRPISFEVFSDDLAEMQEQALEIASWGENVYVKIPITNTEGISTVPLIHTLARAGVKTNVTAIFTLEQVRDTCDAIADHAPGVVSVFAGRVADTGVDPVPMMQEALSHVRKHEGLELLWASPREVLNIFQASDVGCHIITVTNDLIKKLSGVGKALDEFSLETVKMFRNDAVNAGFSLTTKHRTRRAA